MTEPDGNPTIDHGDNDQVMPLLFPSSMEICDTGANSALNDFNPLVESEPNLILVDRETEFDVTDQNSGDVILCQSDMITDAQTKRWSVPVRKLSMEEVEFLSGPRLLPNLAIPNMDPPPVVSSTTDFEAPSHETNSRPVRIGKNYVNYAEQCADEDEGEEYSPSDETEGSDKNNNSSHIK